MNLGCIRLYLKKGNMFVRTLSSVLLQMNYGVAGKTYTLIHMANLLSRLASCLQNVCNITCFTVTPSEATQTLTSVAAWRIFTGACSAQLVILRAFISVCMRI